MKIGFDYWQVISHYPTQIGFLANVLTNNLCDVHVISAVGEKRVGTVRENVEKAFREGNRPFIAELISNGAIAVHEVVFDDPAESPELKLAKCKELGISMFFDDRDDVCRLLNKNHIMAMRVTRKDNSTYDLDAEQK